MKLSIQHKSSFSISHDIKIINIKNTSNQNNNSQYALHTNTKLLPNIQYDISLHIKDNAGNSTLAHETVYGFNDNVPLLLINEFTTEGSKTNPDKVEIVALSDGNLSGIALQQGGVTSYSKRILFPNLNVKKGDFIIIHWAPLPITPLTHETMHKKEATHPQAYNNAWDFFVQDDKQRGLSNTNGSLALIQIWNNIVLDAVIYSTKTR